MQSSIGDSTVTGSSQAAIGHFHGPVNIYGSEKSIEAKKAARLCRNAIYLTDPRVDRDKTVREKGGRTEGTCKWILEDPQFKSWYSSGSGLLWVRGGPGKGKTMISVFLSQWFASGNQDNFIYYFCSGQDEDRNKATSILRGLLWQLTEQRAELTEHLIPHFDFPSRCEATLHSEETLWQLFLDIISLANDIRLRVLIDGLDECDSDSIQWLTSKLTSIDGQQSCQGLSVIILSRRISNLEGCKCIVLDPDHDQQVSSDVETFIRERVQSVSKRLCFSEELHETIVQSLMKKSEGTFLWVSFVIDRLAKERKRSRCEEIIHDLPTGLPAFYARMLKGIGPDDKVSSKLLLTWVAMSFRKLSLETLAAILDCQPARGISLEEAVSDELGICAPIIRHNAQVIDYVHQSAKDYMLRPEEDFDPDLEYFRLRTEDAHLLLAEQCLVALSQGSYLQHYALLDWPRHAKQLSALAEQLIQKADFFFAETSHVREAWWQKFCLNFRGVPEAMPPRLHIACYIGFEPWVRILLSESPGLDTGRQSCIDEQCSNGWSALDYATYGNSGTVQLLLNHRIACGVSEPLREDYLERAALNGHVNTVRSLLASGIDPRQTMQKVCKDGENQAMQTLACSGVDLNYKMDGKSLLEEAAERKHTKTLACLLKNGADPHVITSDNQSLLHTVTRADDSKALGLLLDHGVNIDSVDSSGRTALHQAAEAGSEDLVRLLVDRGAGIEIKDSLGETALVKIARNMRVTNSSFRALNRRFSSRHKRMFKILFFDKAAADASEIEKMAFILSNRRFDLGRKVWFHSERDYADEQAVRKAMQTELICLARRPDSESSSSPSGRKGVITEYSTRAPFRRGT